MSQYKFQANVQNGSNVVQGLNSQFTQDVDVGFAFAVVGDNVTYTVASVTSDTQLTLTAPYSGETREDVLALVVTGFTRNYQFAEISRGDLETGALHTRAMRTIDDELHKARQEIDEVVDLADKVFNESIEIGDGLEGEGKLSDNPRIALGTPGTITGATVNEVTEDSHTHELDITAEDVGLGNVDNTSDKDKPVSDAVGEALRGKADKGVTITAGNGLTGGGDLSDSREITLGTPGTITGSSSNAVTKEGHTHKLDITLEDVGGLNAALLSKADLDSNGKVPLSQINDALVGNVSYQTVWDASTNTPTLPDATTVKGHYYVTDVAGEYEGVWYEVGDWVISDGKVWDRVPNTDAVSSVAGKTGHVILSAEDITSGVFSIDRIPTGTGDNDIRTNSQNDVRYVGVSGDQTVTGEKTFRTQFRMNYGGDGGRDIIFRQDSNAFYIMRTVDGGSGGTWTAYRPVTYYLNTGEIRLNSRGTGEEESPTAGVRIGSPSGGAREPGSLNTERYYINGTELFEDASGVYTAGPGALTNAVSNMLSSNTAADIRASIGAGTGDGNAIVGTGGGQVRTNSQNDGRFMGLGIGGQTITANKRWERPSNSNNSEYVRYTSADIDGMYMDFTLTELSRLDPNAWPQFASDCTHIVRFRQGGSIRDKNIRGMAFGSHDNTPVIAISTHSGTQAGVVLGNPIGGFKGLGTINAEEVYVNGEPVGSGTGGDVTLDTDQIITGVKTFDSDGLILRRSDDGTVHLRFEDSDGKERATLWSESFGGGAPSGLRARVRDEQGNIVVEWRMARNGEFLLSTGTYRGDGSKLSNIPSYAINGLGGMATENPGSGGSQFRTNAQNEAVFAQVSQTTTLDNVIFPLGAVVHVAHGGPSETIFGRNQVATIRLAENDPHGYRAHGTGTPLVGTWRSRGFVQSYGGSTSFPLSTYVFQRVA